MYYKFLTKTVKINQVIQLLSMCIKIIDKQSTLFKKYEISIAVVLTLIKSEVDSKLTLMLTLPNRISRNIRSHRVLVSEMHWKALSYTQPLSSNTNSFKFVKCMDLILLIATQRMSL